MDEKRDTHPRETQPRETIVHIRLSTEEHAILDAGAHAAGLSLGAFMRMAALERARRTTATSPLAHSREDIQSAIDASGGNLARAASRLGCARRTLQNLMRELGMPPGRPGKKPRPHLVSVPKTC